MLQALVQMVDGLFYTTKVTTTNVITRRYYDKDLCDAMRLRAIAEGKPIPVVASAVVHAAAPAPESSEEEDITRKSPTIISYDTHFEVNGRRIPFPSVVLNRPPLFVGDKVDYDSFPNYRYAPLLISYISDTRKFASVDGGPVGRNNEVGGWTRKNILVQHSRYTDAIQGEPPITTAKAQWGDLIISFSIHEKWGYMSVVKQDGSIVQLSQDNIGQFDNDVECVIMAHAYARAILLTYASVDEPIASYDENDLTSTIFALLLAERV